MTHDPVYFKMYDTRGSKEKLLFAGTYIPQGGSKELPKEDHHKAVLELISITNKEGEPHTVENTKLVFLTHEEMDKELEILVKNTPDELSVVRVVCPVCFLLNGGFTNTKSISKGTLDKLEQLTNRVGDKLQMELCVKHRKDAKENKGVYIMATNVTDASTIDTVPFLDTITKVIAIGSDMLQIITSLTPPEDGDFVFCGEKELAVMVTARQAVVDAVDTIWDATPKGINRQQILAFHLAIHNALKDVNVPTTEKDDIPTPSNDTFH